MNIFGTTGQERRAWLDRQGQNVLDAIQYYAGPGIPVNAFATIADAFNPVADIGRAGTAARGAVQPGISPSERAGYVGSALTDMASVLAPVAGAAYAKGPTAALTEGLANWSMPADDAVGRFFVDEDGAIRAWHASPYDFDRFDMNARGYGVGDQAFGDGHYFADTEAAGRGYLDRLRKPSIDGRSAYASDLSSDAQEIVFKYTQEGNTGTLQDVAEFARKDLEARRSSLPFSAVREYEGIINELASRPDARVGQMGHLYEVNIDANPEDFIDWDALTETGQTFGEQFRARASEVGRQAATRELDAPGISYRVGSGDRSRKDYVVFDDRLVDILGKDGQRTTPQGKAQDVLDMLTSGRAPEVTDDMLDLGDPVLNAQLNEYLYRNYDLPMDEASRMARAREMGLTFDTFHGSPDVSNTTELRPSASGEVGRGVYHTRSPDYAEAYTARRDADGDVMVPDGAGILPLRTPEPQMIAREDWVRLRDDEMMRILGERGDEWSRDIPDLAESNITADVPGGFYFQGGGINEQGAIPNPANIRSRFARFDPRLAHLRNLSAGVGGLGIAAGSQSEEERSDDINAILAKYGI